MRTHFDKRDTAGFLAAGFQEQELGFLFTLSCANISEDEQTFGAWADWSIDHDQKIRHMGLRLLLDGELNPKFLLSRKAYFWKTSRYLNEWRVCDLPSAMEIMTRNASRRWRPSRGGVGGYYQFHAYYLAIASLLLSLENWLVGPSFMITDADSWFRNRNTHPYPGRAPWFTLPSAGEPVLQVQPELYE